MKGRIQVISILGILYVMISLPSFASQIKSDASLFSLSPAFCLEESMLKQGRQIGGLHAKLKDRMGNRVEIDFKYSSEAEKISTSEGDIWRYTYYFLNCSYSNLLFLSPPALPYQALALLSYVYGRRVAIVEIPPLQGLKIVFYDKRPPIIRTGLTSNDTYRIVWFLSPFDNSELLGFIIFIHEPDYKIFP
jgi:hypothetical protein